MAKNSISRLILVTLAGYAFAQFPPTPAGVTYLQSKFHENVTISFKEPGLCETTPGVKSYAGYVHLPAGFLDDVSGVETQDYPINTFFWFFESRKDPLNAPLAIWLNGGPGGSSLMGLLEENGPCFVGADSKSTYLNEWSWNNDVNMLYIDQPNQVGFSHDMPTNGTFNVNEQGPLRVVPWDDNDITNVPAPNLTTRYGTFASQNPASTANSTALAAHALWHFAQTWFFEFPHYKPNDNRISLWTESYGGHYGPGIFDFFLKQNEKIAQGSNKEEDAHYLHLDTLGIVNGLIDMVVQGESLITYAYNNSYGLHVFNQSLHDELLHNWTRPGGCKDQLAACQDALEGHGLLFFERGTDALSNACDMLSPECGSDGTNAFDLYRNGVSPGAGWFDVTAPKNDPFPPPYMQGFLTQESVLAALGVPVNYSSSSTSVGSSFSGTHDMIHGGFLASIAHLLESGVKVHLMYGDSDYPCNWVGGEAASLAVPYSNASAFAAAGYAPLLSSDGSSAIKGMTRQAGNFSFTRVFQAGHEVPAYQGRAAYDIFTRATFGLDIPTGTVVTGDGFATRGPRDVWDVKGVPPAPMRPRCYILEPDSCVPEIWEKVLAGDVTVKDWFVVEESEGGDQDALDEL